MNVGRVVGMLYSKHVHHLQDILNTLSIQNSNIPSETNSIWHTKMNTYIIDIKNSNKLFYDSLVEALKKFNSDLNADINRLINTPRYVKSVDASYS